LFFKKKRQLKQEFDDKLLSDIWDLKEKWMQARHLHGNSSHLIVSNEQGIEATIAKVKYFYLFKEAKIRKISAK